MVGAILGTLNESITNIQTHAAVHAVKKQEESIQNLQINKMLQTGTRKGLIGLKKIRKGFKGRSGKSQRTCFGDFLFGGSKKKINKKKIKIKKKFWTAKT